MPVSLNTNMDWKATPGYNAANGTAGEADPETGIVKCEPGTTARTDSVEINFCGGLPEGQAEKVRSHVAALKGSRRLATTASELPPTEGKTYAAKMIRVTAGSFDKTAVGADGSTFSVKYAYDKETRLDFRDNYLSGMKAVANDSAEQPDANLYYSNNIKADILSYFSSASSLAEDDKAIAAAYVNAMKELKQNIAAGVKDPAEKVKTTVTVNGTEWNFAELVKTVDKMNDSFSFFEYKGNLDYPDYAKMGVSKADVKSWAKENLSAEKQSVVAKSLEARVSTFIQREKEDRELMRDIWDKPGFVMPEEKAEYYETQFISATNKEAREKIMRLFEETDYSSPASVANSVNRYRNMMSPIYLAFGASKRALPEYLDSAVKDIYSYIGGLFGDKATGNVNASV